MGWMQKLHETYNAIEANASDFQDFDDLVPVGCAVQNAHIEIVLNEFGDFLRARCLGKESTIIPATEDSAGRSSSMVAPYPICDKIHYVAGDYPKHGGTKKNCFYDFKNDKAGDKTSGYLMIMRDWARKCPHVFLHAVLRYVEKETVVADLVRSGVLRVDGKGNLLKKKDLNASAYDIFKKTGLEDQGDAFVRWRVEVPGNPESAVWENEELRLDWKKYYPELLTKGYCFISTQDNVPISEKHPRRIRNAGDGAKLISSNDGTNFTFLGRFLSANEACEIGYDVSQKAHSALRWLVGRQGYCNDEQVIVAWTSTGKKIPEPMSDIRRMLEDEGSLSESGQNAEVSVGDVGELYALRLAKKIAGYRADLPETEEVAVMGLDAISQGRIAVTYYREMMATEFIDRVESWHRDYAWYQYYEDKKAKRYCPFVGAPSPKDIAEAAMWFPPKKNISASVIKARCAIVQRLLPCIVEGHQIPRDILVSLVNRASNSVGLKSMMAKENAETEWKRILGITCGVFRGFYKERGYKMALDEERNTRDYLYGRLLAIAESIESKALSISKEERETNAVRLMQRFSTHPYSTWRNLELRLNPYVVRLKNSCPDFLYDRNAWLNKVHALFDTKEYMDDSRLSGEFLLGYHCQMKKLFEPNEKKKGDMPAQPSSSDLDANNETGGESDV